MSYLRRPTSLQYGWEGTFLKTETCLWPQGVLGLYVCGNSKGTVATSNLKTANVTLISVYLLFSSYPELRVKKDSKGENYGVAGTVDLLQNMTFSSQPLSAFDWCPEKLGLALCTSFDQTLRLIIVTKLNTFWHVLLVFWEITYVCSCRLQQMTSA